MAKTDFTDGTTPITAAFADSIYLTDGGHKHDGGSEDGSASKINPKDHIDWADMDLDLTESAIADPLEGIDYHVLKYTCTAGGGDLAGISTDRGYFGSLRAKTSVILASGMQFFDEKIRSAGRFGIRNAADSAFQDMECARLYAENTTVTGTVGTVDVSASGDVTVESNRSCADLLPWAVIHADGRTTNGSCTVNKDANSRVSAITRGALGAYVVDLSSNLDGNPMPVTIMVEQSGNTGAYATITSWSDNNTFAFAVHEDMGLGNRVDPDAFTIVIWNF